MTSSAPLRLTHTSRRLDLAPDGKRFAVFPGPDTTREPKGSLHLTFLLNFFEEVRRLARVN